MTYYIISISKGVIKMPTILVVDDEKEICDLIEIYLKNDGFDVFKSYDGVEALNLVKENHMDLIVLDVMMPNMDGIEFCKHVRETDDIPIIMLSAKIEDMDKIFGLMTGADDYMTKPFNPFELIARIKSQLRRYGGFNKTDDAKQTPCEDEVLFNGLYINKNQHTATLYDKDLMLTPTEFDILWLLAKNIGKVFSSEEIFEAVWQEKYLDANNTVMVHIRHLREKLGDDSKNSSYIKTVWGVGYKI